MEKRSFELLASLRADFARAVESWNARLPDLGVLEDQLRITLGYDDYTVETPIVYNAALDEITAEDDPAWILVADNPGMMEQKAANRRYLVGQAGKLAESFFERELKQSFRKTALIINKTPIHTKKTAELSRLLKMDKSGDLRHVFEESQRFMANMAFRLYEALNVPIWICGKMGLSAMGLFSAWYEEFSSLFSAQESMDKVLVFSHFSMNRFTVELKVKRDLSKPLDEELRRIGVENRRSVFGR